MQNRTTETTALRLAAHRCAGRGPYPTGRRSTLRRHRILGVAAAGLLTLTAACGNGSGGTGGTSAPESGAPAPVGAVLPETTTPTTTIATTTTAAPVKVTATTPGPAPAPVTATEAPAPVDLTEVDAFLATLDSELAGADQALATSEGDF